MLLHSSGFILEADQVSINFACDVPKSSRNPETYDNRYITITIYVNLHLYIYVDTVYVYTLYIHWITI